MKIKNVKLEWNVLFYDMNKNMIRPYNIFYDNFPKELSKTIKKEKINNREELKNYLTRHFKYLYWSKTEYEIYVSGLFSFDKGSKIDIWHQISCLCIRFS